jgi:hypothetical protein
MQKHSTDNGLVARILGHLESVAAHLVAIADREHAGSHDDLAFSALNELDRGRALLELMLVANPRLEEAS